MQKIGSNCSSDQAKAQRNKKTSPQKIKSPQNSCAKLHQTERKKQRKQKENRDHIPSSNLSRSILFAVFCPPISPALFSCLSHAMLLERMAHHQWTFLQAAFLLAFCLQMRKLRPPTLPAPSKFWAMRIAWKGVPSTDISILHEAFQEANHPPRSFQPREPASKRMACHQWPFRQSAFL